MQVKVGIVENRARGTAAGAALLAAVLSGCAGPDGSHAPDGRAHPSASAMVRTAASGGTVGTAGSSCELPVTFALAKNWKAKGVDAETELAKASSGPDGDLSASLADLFLRQGPVTAACEIDAKPAGHIGFLRVWTGGPDDTDARAVLRAFVAAEEDVSKERYHTFTTPTGLSGVEAEYVTTSKLLDETRKQRALAVATPDGPVVLHLGGLDSEEHEAMLPAYELAKQTLRVT
ncbi:lipoprotein [Streptomyces sp. MS06]|uniref:lipoprotein n=1 Tax=Streptomyces sp. MS06 TaxID=3385974 RepID=UPI0039A20D9B